MIDELIETLAKDGLTVNPAPHPFTQSLRWAGLAALYLVLALAISGLRPDLALQFHKPWFIAEIAALLLIFASTSVSAALLSFPDMHQMRTLTFAPLISLGLLVLVMFLAGQNPPAPPPVHSFECTTGITLMALLPALWTLYAMRNYASTHYRLAGSVALLSAFCVGALWLRLHEATDSILHLIEWHYLPMLGFGLIGLWLGGKTLKW